MTLALTVSAATIVAALIAGATSPTWAFWASSNVSGSTTATVTSLNAQAAPTVSSTDRAVVVHWAPNTLATGSAATGYTVKRYSAGNVAQVVANNCAGIIKNYGCIEQFVPAGTWTYTVTARFDTDGGAGWYGAESAKSAAVTSNGVSSTNNVWMWITP